MGQALGERGERMKAVPSKTAEAVLGILLPPACREQVLGDLHERYTGPVRYFGDALSAVPCVIISRIRRTTDTQVLLMEAFALYLSFVGVAWISGQSAFLFEPWGLLRLAIPTAVVLVALVLAIGLAARCNRQGILDLCHRTQISIARSKSNASSNPPMSFGRKLMSKAWPITSASTKKRRNSPRNSGRT